MNVFDRAGHKWRKNRKRGVSPIIATILLVAITVVLAAVLYVLISGLTHTGASTPYTLGMSAPTASSYGTNGYSYTITATPQTGLTTGMFGLSLQTATGGVVTGAAKIPSTTCKVAAAFSSTTCTLPTATGWYAVLYWLGNDSVANAYNATSNSWTAPTLPVTNAEALVVIWYSSATGNPSLTGSSDTLSAFSVGSSSVSGSSGPF